MTQLIIILVFFSAFLFWYLMEMNTELQRIYTNPIFKEAILEDCLSDIDRKKRYLKHLKQAERLKVDTERSTYAKELVDAIETQSRFFYDIQHLQAENEKLAARNVELEELLEMQQKDAGE